MKSIFSLLILIISISLNSQNIFTVTKTTDPDPFVHQYNNDDNLCDTAMYGTLQWAIRKANDSQTQSTINFNIPGSEIHEINLNAYLPQIIKPVIIDATSQLGYSKGNPTIIINGRGKISDGLNFYGITNFTVKGIGIENFTERGIRVRYCENSYIYDCVINGIIAIPSSKQPLAIGISFNESINSEVFGNNIGFGLNATQAGITNIGIATFSNSNHILIGNTELNKQNTIKNCISNGFTTATAIGIGNTTFSNTISGNILINNTTGISLDGTGNNAKSAPDSLLYYTDNNLLVGIAEPNDIIEIFGSLAEESANEYITTASTDVNGNWQANLTNYNYNSFVATATDGSGNSSMLTRSINDCANELCFCHNDSICICSDTINYNICHFDTICLGDSITFQVCEQCHNSFPENGTIYFDFNDHSEFSDGYYDFNFVDTVGHNSIWQISFTPEQTGTFSVDIDNSISVSNHHYFYTVLPPPTVEILHDQLLCSNTGTILSTNPSFNEYLWNTGETTSTITADISGTYTVTVTDIHGCIAETSINIELIDVNPMILGNDSICAGESTTLTAIGGVSYIWNNGITNNSITVFPTANTTYYVTVTDANGCTGTANFTLYINPLPIISLEASPNPVCYGNDINLSVTALPIGNYTYVWSGNVQSFNGASATDNNLTQNEIYSVTVTDNLTGCSAFDNIEVIVLPELNPIIQTNHNNYCVRDGPTNIFVPISISNPYTNYFWSTGETTNLITVDPQSGTTYTVTVTDANGCIGTAFILINIYPLPEINITSTNMCEGQVCEGSAIITNANFSTSYHWSNNSTNTVQNNLCEGIYTVTATNTFTHCSNTETVNIITNPNPIINQGNIYNTCFGECQGADFFTISNATPPLSFNILPYATLGSTFGLYYYNNLCPGVYTHTVTDANGCSATNTFTIVEYDEITITPTITNILCYGNNNGSITTNVTGGTPPYTYEWSNGSTDPNITGLTEGTYTLTVTDANNCTQEASYTLTEPAQITISTSHINNSDCTGSVCNGTATVNNISGGTTPSSYIWNTTPIQTTPTATGLCAGTYTVTVTDDFGCIGTANVEIENIITAPTVEFTATIPECLTANTTPVTFTNTSTGATSYLWNFADGTTSTDVNPTHIFEDYGSICVTLTATDNCGVSATTSQVVNVIANDCECSVPYDFVGTNIVSGTWNNTTGSLPGRILVDGDIIVATGTQLTISDVEVNFSSRSRIIVEKAAKLNIINNAKLTNLFGYIDCLNMWYGIEAWGNSSSSSSNSQQAVVTIKYGSVENAHIAVLLGKRNIDANCDYALNPFDDNYSGAVLKAYDSEFYRNGKDVEYRKKLNSNASANNITQNIFECTQGHIGYKLYDEHYKDNSTHPYPNNLNPWAGTANQYGISTDGIIMERQAGIIIKECKFITHWNGVKAYDSKFTLTGDPNDPYLNPPASSEFKSVVNGITIKNSVTNMYSCNINNTSFKKITGIVTLVGTAIKIERGYNNIIYNNYFNNGELPINQAKFVNGVILKNTTGIKLTENKFEKIKYAVQQDWGVTGTIGAGSPWKGNRFEKCYLSIYTKYDNKHVILPCNDHFPDANAGYSGKNWDNYGLGWVDVSVSPPPVWNYIGLNNQGSITKPSGNEFWGNNYLKRINSNPLSPYNYTYHTGNPIYNPEVISSVTKTNSGLSYPGDISACSNPAPVVPPLLPALNFSTYPFSELDNIKNLIAEYALKRDSVLSIENNGKTDYLTEQILNNNNNKLKLTNILIENSPLSDELLLLVLEENALNPIFLTNLLQVNTPVSNKVYSGLYNYINSSFPFAFKRRIIELQGNNNSVETATSFTRKIDMEETKYSILLNNIVSTLNDTINNRPNDAIAVLEYDGSDLSKQILFGTYLNGENYSMANQKLIELNNNNNVFNSDFVNLNSIILNLTENNKTIYDISNDDFNYVNQLARICPPFPAVYQARVIVEMLTGEEIADCEILDIEEKSSEISDNSNTILTELYLGDNYPDPFSTETTIPFKLEEKASGLIVVKDILGKIIAQYNINSTENKIVLKTKNWENGMYFYSLIINNELLFTKKMIVKH